MNFLLDVSVYRNTYHAKWGGRQTPQEKSALLVSKSDSGVWNGL